MPKPEARWCWVNIMKIPLGFLRARGPVSMASSMAISVMLEPVPAEMLVITESVNIMVSHRASRSVYGICKPGSSVKSLVWC